MVELRGGPWGRAAEQLKGTSSQSGSLAADEGKPPAFLAWLAQVHGWHRSRSKEGRTESRREIRAEAFGTRCRALAGIDETEHVAPF